MVNIEKLSKDVACWRKSKKSRGERIPAHLLSMALELSRLHGIEAIAKSGSFTRDQLQKAMNGRPDQQKEQKSTEVPLKYGILEVPAPEPEGSHDLELHFPSGAKLIFPADGKTAAMAGKFLSVYEGGKR
ncbi:MAG: hypothetical protein H6618_01370 [Deltaproteobacteria bacterium]|nr:hypothetical protein [Deltaproteobacteria bacterium]